MTLLDTILALVLSVGVAASGMLLINGGVETLKQQEKLGVYVATVPELRATTTRLIQQAAQVRVFSSQSAARGASDVGTSVSGEHIRLNFRSGSAVPSGSTTWQSTLEFRNGFLVYRNQDGKEWNITRGTGSFTLSEGVLLIAFTKGAVAATIAVAVN